ncbi:MAG: glycosyl hydrolase [Solirubrobacterales bacterium]|nr:glycosyl hydrolase [Solirubrobacterales bacterium]
MQTRRLSSRLCGLGVAVSAIAVLTGAVWTAAVPAAHAATAQCPWMDATQSPDQRAGELVGAMTLDQKLSMLHSAEPDMLAYYGTAGHVAAIPGLCVPDLVLNDAGAGVGDGQVNATAFPAGIAQAASWDPNVQQQFGAGLGWEAWHKGINVMLAPGVNIDRVPMNGRNFEYASEDPYLAGQTGAAVIRGIQSQNVIATVKHLAANNQETNRMTVSADVDERTLHEIYLPAFETAVKQGKAGAVMCSYNQLNSVYACENPALLTDVLKKEFGFSGFVMSDWGATHSTVAAANAGLDMEMAGSNNGQYFGDALKTAVINGQVSMARLNDMVTRIVRSAFADGLFDHPAAAEPDGFAAVVNTPAEATLARTIAEQGTVLLKNKDGLLPLDGQGKKIALIGQAAGAAGAEQAYGGGGSSHVPLAGAVPVVSPQQGITQRGAANGDTVVYADGTSVADAVAAAKAADVAIVYANDSEAEGTDRTNLGLNYGTCSLVACAQFPVSQDQLIGAVAEANPNTIVVLNTGGPVRMPWLGQVESVVEAWYPGQEDGNAAAAVLFGDVNPSGKLPETFPVSENDLPTQTTAQYPGVNGHASYSEGLRVGYRWYDSQNIAPLFPFGHGLSYTTFSYSGLRVSRTASGASVTLTITNTGTRAGAEVAQVYLAAPAAAGEPPKQLKAYQKVFLNPGQARSVTVPVDSRAFAQWDTTKHTWLITPGTYQVLVGSSSRDIRAQSSLTMAAKTLAP